MEAGEELRSAGAIVEALTAPPAGQHGAQGRGQALRHGGRSPCGTEENDEAFRKKSSVSFENSNRKEMSIMMNRRVKIFKLINMETRSGFLSYHYAPWPDQTQEFQLFKL